MHYLTRTLIDALHSVQGEINPPKQDWQSEYAYSDLRHWDMLMQCCDLLDDQESRELYAKIIVYRVMMALLPEQILNRRFSIYPADVWNAHLEAAAKLPGVDGDYVLDRVETWILKGYEYGSCRVQPGDTVIEGGSFTGNTTQYFAELAGAEGKVYSFEPVPSIFSTLAANMGKYPQVIPVNCGLAAADGAAQITESGAASTVRENGTLRIALRSVDSFVQEQRLDHVDFIKMDIEGSEFDAIRGAETAIRRFTPKLAVCLYHRPEDIYRICLLLHSMCPSYAFHLKHSSNSHLETVLFARPSAGPRDIAAPEPRDDESRIICELGSVLAAVLDKNFSYDYLRKRDVIKILLRKLGLWDIADACRQKVLYVARGFKKDE